MSKGLGRIERTILATMRRGKKLTSGQLTLQCGGDLTIALRKTVLRAMHSLVRKYPQYALTGGRGQTELSLVPPPKPKRGRANRTAEAPVSVDATAPASVNA
jgi:hypothetical protein